MSGESVPTEARAGEVAPAPGPQLRIWALVAILVLVEVFFAGRANSVVAQILDADECATAWDIPWAWALAATFWVALALTVVIVGRGARGGHRGDVVWGSLAIVGQIIIGAVCWAFTAGGFGWHCPI
jgi:hypothetical protein